MIYEIIKDSLEYTFKDITVLKLGLLSLSSFLIIPLLILGGYSYRTTLIGVNSIINTEDPKAKFSNPTKLLIEGIKLIILILVYSIPGIVASYLLAISGNLFHISNLGFQQKLEFNLEAIAILAIIWFFCFLFISVAIPYMAEKKGSLKSGLNITKIIPLIKKVGILIQVGFVICMIIAILGITGLIFFLVEFLITTFTGYTGMIVSGSRTIAIYAFIWIFFMVPSFILFESRAIALIYNTKIEEDDYY